MMGLEKERKKAKKLKQKKKDEICDERHTLDSKNHSDIVCDQESPKTCTKAKKRHSSGDCDNVTSRKQVHKGATEMADNDKLALTLRRKEKRRKDKFKDKVPDFLKLLQSKQIPFDKEEKPVTKTEEEIQHEKMKEEKRVRMRQKRIAKKAQKKQNIESTVARDEALQYLSLWNSSRDAWRFQKVRQVWLLAHMYDPQNVSSANFEMLLQYIENLKGLGRDKTREEAEKILADAEKTKDNENETEDDGENEADVDDSDADSDRAKGRKKSKTKNKDKSSELVYTQVYRMPGIV